MLRAEEAAGQAEHQPGDQQEVTLIAPAQDGIPQADGEEQSRDGIGHRLAGQVVLALQVAGLVEEFEHVADILEERLQAVLLAHVAEDADLCHAVVHGERLGNIRHGDRGNCHQGGNGKDGEPQPAAPECGAHPRRIGQHPEQDIEQQGRRSKPGAEIGVDRQPHQQAAEGVVEGTPVAQAADQEERRQDLEQGRGGLVPAPAAHAQVPAADRQQEHGSQPHGRTKHQPAQEVDGGDREDRRNERDQLQAEPPGAEELDQAGHVIDIAICRPVPAGAEGRYAASLQDVQRIQPGIGLVDVDAGWDALEMPGAQEDRQEQDQDKGGDLQPAAVGRIAPPGGGGRRPGRGPADRTKQPGAGQHQEHGAQPGQNRTRPHRPIIGDQPQDDPGHQQLGQGHAQSAQGPPSRLCHGGQPGKKRLARQPQVEPAECARRTEHHDD